MSAEGGSNAVVADGVGSGAAVEVSAGANSGAASAHSGPSAGPAGAAPLSPGRRKAANPKDVSDALRWYMQIAMLVVNCVTFVFTCISMGSEWATYDTTPPVSADVTITLWFFMGCSTTERTGTTAAETCSGWFHSKSPHSLWFLHDAGHTAGAFLGISLLFNLVALLIEYARFSTATSTNKAMWTVVTQYGNPFVIAVCYSCVWLSLFFGWVVFVGLIRDNETVPEMNLQDPSFTVGVGLIVFVWLLVSLAWGWAVFRILHWRTFQAQPDIPAKPVPDAASDAVAPAPAAGGTSVTHLSPADEGLDSPIIDPPHVPPPSTDAPPAGVGAPGAGPRPSWGTPAESKAMAIVPPAGTTDDLVVTPISP